MRYKDAPEVRTIAEDYIERNHTHLREIPILYFFREKAGRSGSKETWGKAIKKTGLDAYSHMPLVTEEFAYGREYFIMEIAFDVWQRLKPEQREALVDHELCHMGIGDEDQLTIIPHDVEDFAAVVQRHGVKWNCSLQTFAGAVMSWEGQASIPLVDAESGVAPESLVEEVLLRYIADPVVIKKVLTDLRPYIRDGEFHQLLRNGRASHLTIHRGGLPLSGDETEKLEYLDGGRVDTGTA